MRRGSLAPKMACNRNLYVDAETRCLGEICQSKVMFLAGNNQDGYKPRFRSAIPKDQKTTSVKNTGTRVSSVSDAETSPAPGILI